MSSTAFIIPASGSKRIGVPGMMTYLGLMQTVGTYDYSARIFAVWAILTCLSKVIVMPAAEYYKCISAEEVGGLAAEGRSLYRKRDAWMSQHGWERKVGPTFKGLRDSIETVLTEGKERKVKVDDEYIKHYIEHPNVDVVKDTHLSCL